METKAYAKVNLTLEVLGRRPDGYHEVRTVFQTIDLSDRLHFSPAPRLELQCSAPALGEEDNQVWKAAEALRRATGCDKGARIHLEKHIPIDMGLGGGSSDGAATLMALNGLWGLGIDDGELRSIAMSLGSDVPFFLYGGTALAKGRGEMITGLPPLSQRWMVLLCPLPQYAGSGVSPSHKTARLYSMLTQEHYTDGGRTGRLVDALKGAGFSQELMFNVFEMVAPSAFPGFEQARKDFLGSGVGSIHLSGTGPALYTFVACKEEGEGVLKSLKKRGLRAYCVTTVQPGTPSPD